MDRLVRRVATLIVATLLSIGVLGTSAQADPTEVNVRIEGQRETLFEGPLWTEGHDVRASSDTQERSCDGINPLDPENTTPGPTPTAASVDAMSLIGESFDGDWYPGYDDYFITRWGPDEQSPVNGAYWGVLVNDVFTNVGGCQYELREGDEVLWLYSAFKGRANLALFPAGDTASRPPLTATAELGTPFEVEVLDYGDNKEDNPPAEPDRANATPYEGADVSPVLTSAKGFEKVQSESPEAVRTDGEGRASITFTTPGWHRLKAGTPLSEGGEEAAIRSNRIDVCVSGPGESGCGPPPGEDSVRTPASLEKQHEVPAEGGAVGEGPDSGEPGSGMGISASGTPVQAPVHVADVSGRLSLESLNPRRLLLQLTAAGRLTVRIARWQPGRRPLRWRLVKAIVVKAGKAGKVVVELPRLTPGRYRVSIALAGSAATVTRVINVPRGRA